MVHWIYDQDSRQNPRLDSDISRYLRILKFSNLLYININFYYIRRTPNFDLCLSIFGPIMSIILSFKTHREQTHYKNVDMYIRVTEENFVLGND